MSKQPTAKEQVKSGFKRAAAWLVGMAWLGLVYWGVGAITEAEGSASEQTHSRLLGYALLAIASLIFVTTANHWKRMFPRIMLATTLGALLELEQGHAVNSPSVLIPRWIGVLQLVVIAGVTVVSFTFKKRPLNIVDRIALLAFAASIFVGGGEATRKEPPLALIVGGVCILVAWTYERLQSRPETNVTT